jgi:hypothetical protein
MCLPDRDAYRCPAGEMLTFRRHTYESDKSTNMKVGICWTSKCGQCPLKSQCTSAQERRLRRWVHEDVIEAMDASMAAMGNAMTVRKQTAEHPFGTLKMWMGAAPFLCKSLKKVRTEMSLSVLAHNLRRMIAILGVEGLKAALARSAGRRRRRHYIGAGPAAPLAAEFSHGLAPTSPLRRAIKSTPKAAINGVRITPAGAPGVAKSQARFKRPRLCARAWRPGPPPPLPHGR